MCKVEIYYTCSKTPFYRKRISANPSLKPNPNSKPNLKAL